MFIHQSINRNLTDGEDAGQSAIDLEAHGGEIDSETERMQKSVCGIRRVKETLLVVTLLNTACCDEWCCVAFYCPVHSCVWTV